jgi:hypothetical protein
MERVSRVEDLKGIHGDFFGMVRPHPDRTLKYRALAYGLIV